MTKSIGVIVAGEIGPKETRLALCGLDIGRPIVVVEETTPHDGSGGLAPVVQRFLNKYRPGHIRVASFVAAGPVHDGVSRAADLPWPIEADAVAAELGIEKVNVLNDVEAIAHAIQTVVPDDVLALSRGDALDYGNQVVISVGRCPGISGLYWNGTEHLSFVSEGIHADFAPSSAEELRMALHLSERVPRVTVELLLSTEGLSLIDRYFSGDGKGGTAAVPLRAAQGADGICPEALEAFLSICGSTAANLALTLRATGGVYLAGDLVRKLRGPLASGAFQTAFCRKGPVEALLTSIPVFAVLDERAALLGAAAVAARDLRVRLGGGWAS